MIKQPYVNMFLKLRDWLIEEVNKILAQLPQTIPCKIIANNGETVDVQPILNLNVPVTTLTKVPIVKSKYINIPFSVGDIGMLIPASYIYNDLILTDLDFISNPKKSTNISGYLFLPLIPISKDYITAGTNTNLYSQDGSSYISVQNGDIILNSNEAISFNKLKTFLDNWKLNYNNNITTENINLGIITAAFSSLGVPVTLTPWTPYNGDYR